MNASSLTPQLAIKLVALVEAKKRIPDRYRNVIGVSFFGYEDDWRYEAVEDGRICPICQGHAISSLVLPGSAIRGIWSYVTILNVNLMGGPGAGGNGLCHPNCRCRLHRNNETFAEPIFIDITKQAFGLPETQFRVIKL